MLFSSVLLISVTVNAGLYRWVDETGKVHYSDKMPVAASKKAHTELAGNGLIKKNIDPEETIRLATEKKHKLTQEEEKRKAEEERKLLEQAQKEQETKRDRFLLSTYENKDELIHFFENKIKLLEGNSKILKTQSTFLHKKLKKLEKKKDTINNYNTRKLINRKIVKIQKTISQYDKALEENAKELMTISINYKNDYNRFTELTK